jgi:hypothetical protein
MRELKAGVDLTEGVAGLCGIYSSEILYISLKM